MYLFQTYRKLIIITLFLFLLTSTFIFVFLYSQERSKRIASELDGIWKDIKIEELEKQNSSISALTKTDSKIQECLDLAKQEHKERWVRNCQLENKTLDESDSCGLPKDKAIFLSEQYQENKKLCLERYK